MTRPSRHRSCLLLLGGFGILSALPTAGRAAGIRDLSDGWLLSPAAVAAFLDRRPAPPRGAWVLAGQSRLYGLPDLPVVQLRLGVRRGPRGPSLGLNWQALGDGLFQEQQHEAHLQWGRRPVLGVAIRSLTVRSGGALGFPEQTAGRWQVALTTQFDQRWGPDASLQAQAWWFVAAGGSWSGGEGRRPLLRVQGWRGPTAAALVVDLKADRTPIVGVEWSLGNAGGAWGLRVDPATGSLGPVFSWRRGAMLLRSSHLLHPQLGTTHRWQIGWGSWGAPRW